MLLSQFSRYFIAFATFLGATAVMFGAYASHGLSSWANASQVSQVQLAAEYQLFHAITLIIVALLHTCLSNNITARRFISLSAWFFAVGTLCFSGSLYYLVFWGSKLLVLITPLGGLLLIFAWLSLGFSMFIKQK